MKSYFFANIYHSPFDSLSVWNIEAPNYTNKRLFSWSVQAIRLSSTHSQDLGDYCIVHSQETSWLFFLQIMFELLCVQKAEFLDEIQTKVLRVFVLTIQSPLYSFALRFPFLQTQTTSYSFCNELLYTVKEKGGKIYRKHTLFQEIHTQTSRLINLKILPRNLKEIVCSWIRLQKS